MRWVPPRDGARIEDEDVATDAAEFLSTLLYAVAKCSLDVEGFILCRESDAPPEAEATSTSRVENAQEKNTHTTEEEAQAPEGGAQEADCADGDGEGATEGSFLLVPLPILGKALLDALPGSEDMIADILRKADDVAIPRAMDSDVFWPGLDGAVSAMVRANGCDEDDSSDDEGKRKGGRNGSSRQQLQGNSAIHIDVALDLCLGTWYDLMV